MAENALDLNDPNSWPDDVEALADIAEAGGDEDDNPSDSSTEDPGDNAGAEAGEAGSEAEGGGEAASEGEKDQPTEGETAEGASDAESSADATGETGETGESEEEEAPISTKDGKHTLPYSVLRAERDAKKAAVEEAKQLRDEIERLKSEREGAGDTSSAESSKPTAKEQSEIDSKVEAIRAEWGDDIAEMYRANFELQAEVKRQQETIKRINEENQTRTQTEQSRLEATIQDAIDSSPQMVEWQAQEDGVWYGRAVATHKMLMESDPEYAAKDWSERFSELPGRVQALYGKAPAVAESKPVSKPAAPSAADPKAAVEAAKQKAGEKPPLSMSELPTGEPPATDEFEQLDNMSPAQVQAKIDALADNPEKLDAFLRGLA